MSDETYGYTKQDVAKQMQKEEANKHAGSVPAGSAAAGIQSIVDSSSENQSKDAKIAERQSNLPMPEVPPTRSDFNTNDTSTMNVGSGGRSDDFSAGGEAGQGLRGPATGGSAVREQGAAFKENTAGMNVGRVPGGTASDAAAGSRKTGQTDAETRGADYGYPQKADPSTDAATRAPKETTLSSSSTGPGSS